MLKNSYRTLVWIALWLPPVALALTNTTTFTNTISQSVGSTNAAFLWVTTTIGAVGGSTIAVGDLGTCTIPPGPYPDANCHLSSGSGTIVDPFLFGCSTPLTLSNCTLLGTPFVIAAGGMDIDTHTHTQTAFAAPAAAMAVPLEPWVPIVTGIGIALLAVGWQLGRARR